MSLAPVADRPYFAAFLDLRGKPGVVVGGGPVAAQKAEALLRSGVRLTVLAPEFCERMSELAVLGALRLEAKRFQPGDLVGAEIVIAATDDPAVNEAVSAAAKALRIPVNVADDAARSTFIMPSVVDRPPLQVAISSAGNSPVLARKLRTLVEAAVPAGFGRLAAFIGRHRAQSKRALPDPEARRRFWEEVVDGPVSDLVMTGNEVAASEILRRNLSGNPQKAGFVSLVGAGPGDPDLLTLRALRVMQSASVVLYDHLVSPQLVDLVRRDAWRIYVGKEQDNHALPQGEINALMVKLARAGERVVRLKGGDPYVFGRGGEEIEALVAAGLRFQVVPGVSAAEGCAAYAGIPLTLRGVAHAVLLTTGHAEEHTAAALAEAPVGQTLAFYMGVARYDEIREELLRRGYAPETPVAVVESGTTDRQRVIRTALRSLARAQQALEIRAPALLLVGETTRFAERYAWFQPSKLEIFDEREPALARVTR